MKKCSYLLAVPPVSSVAWSPDARALRYLDQRALPAREVMRDAETLADVIDAIRTLAIRGAPAIGVAAAIGLVVALERDSNDDASEVRRLLPLYAAQLVAARPTAVNLQWAVDRVVACAARTDDAVLCAEMRREATAILREDGEMCDAIGRHGQSLLTDGARVMTHCNAGALATAGIGTALAPVYVAHAQGRRIHVYANETRPLRQGARLTAWELQRAGIAVTVLPDGAAAPMLRSGLIDVVIVGADRVAANGDVANKIGTYAVALAARAHNVPFYVAAPWSTFDLATPHGDAIEIELRGAEELGDLPAGVEVWNPSFDITPRALITGYLTDRGFVAPPFPDS